MSYVWKQLFQAVYTLATREKSLRESLVDVYTYHLLHLDEDTSPGDIFSENLYPEHLKNDLRQLCSDITEFEGTAEATIHRMDDAEVLETVEKILSVYDEITKYEPKN